MSRILPQDAGGQNICAFLDMLAVSEGTSRIAGSDDGYMVIVGGGLFTGYADHPRQLIALPNLHIKSTAAGRYQILEHMYDVYKMQLGLPDFSPISQDKIAIQLMRECHALPMLQNGDINSAVTACASRWASLPGNSYGQHQQTMEMLINAYESAGGTIGA